MKPFEQAAIPPLLLPSFRQHQIASQFLARLDQHLTDLRNGAVQQGLQIRELAAQLFIHPTHLSNTIKEVLGKSACQVYEEKLLQLAKELLAGPQPISHIAFTLDYDPSNFTRFFKRFTGISPRQYRNGLQDLRYRENPEKDTI